MKKLRKRSYQYSGIKGLEDLQFDPMKLKKMQILDDDGPVSINTTISKGVVTGFSSIVVVENVYVLTLSLIINNIRFLIC